MSYRGSKKGNYGNSSHKSKFTLYRAHVRGSYGSVVVPFTEKKQAETYIRDYKRTNPNYHVETRIEKISVPENRLSALDKSAFKGGKVPNSSPKITIVMNRFGHLHVFEGKPKLNMSNINNIKTEDGKESGMYLQNQGDVEEMEAYLSKKQKQTLAEGWPVTINDDAGFF